MTAIDGNLILPLETGLVESANGLSLSPRKPVDWLVCDVVEQPARIAALVGDWVASALCRKAIFNLKLPMNKRYEEVKRCRGLIETRLGSALTDYTLAFKQLYHDRAEITGYISKHTE